MSESENSILILGPGSYVIISRNNCLEDKLVIGILCNSIANYDSVKQSDAPILCNAHIVKLKSKEGLKYRFSMKEYVENAKKRPITFYAYDEILPLFQICVDAFEDAKKKGEDEFMFEMPEIKE